MSLTLRYDGNNRQENRRWPDYFSTTVHGSPWFMEGERWLECLLKVRLKLEGHLCGRLVLDFTWWNNFSDSG